jgi:hypothetical protein
MKTNKIYEHSLMPGVFIRVDVIRKRTTEKMELDITWYRYDEGIKKLISMEVSQQMTIPNDDIKHYKEIM